MTTKQIDYCIELAHTLNYSKAADNLFTSQPTFSYQIRLLEAEIGFTIFERSGKGAALTPEPRGRRNTAKKRGKKRQNSVNIRFGSYGIQNEAQNN